MITLKLGAYTETEVAHLRILLSNNLRDVQHYWSDHCGNECSTCEARHLCADLTQAELYALEFKPTR